MTINTNAAFDSYEAALNEVTRLKAENERYREALKYFQSPSNCTPDSYKVAHRALHPKEPSN